MGRMLPGAEQIQFIEDVRDKGGIGLCEAWSVDTVMSLLDALDQGRGAVDMGSGKEDNMIEVEDV